MVAIINLLSVITFLLISQDGRSQDDDEPYRGKEIGKINSYHHQVSGDVYAVDDWTILIVNFNYDGTGDDAFFWAGDSGRPGPQGFIVPDQHGKTNILERYYNDDVRITLPEGKRISRLKWFAIYDIASQNTFGDVYIPDEFDAPAPRSVGPLAGTSAVSSLPVQVLDSRTILIPSFRYDGSGEEVYFWTGVGPQASSRGLKIPDGYGYLEPIGVYPGEDVRLVLPGDLSVFKINWIAIYDAARKQTLASVLIPENLNVPPALFDTHPHKNSLPHCKQLHRDYQVGWELFGDSITITLAAKIAEDQYMAFGISGSDSKSQMLGADVAVAQYDPKLQRGLATDYNITALAPCVQVLGQWVGVCRDDRLGFLDNNQMFTASRDNGITIVTYRRPIKSQEAIDRDWHKDKLTYIVWAIGNLDHAREPAFHTLYNKRDIAFNMTKTGTENRPDSDCVPFVVGNPTAPTPWETAELFDPSLRVFSFRLGPSGGLRGLGARGASPPLAWYVNGQLAPHLQLRRGLSYTFKVYGGNNPHSASEYHPLIVTSEPFGGLERLTEAQQRAVPVLAGVHYTRRGRLSPTAAGGLCLATHAPGADRRRDDDFPTFRAFNKTLQWHCDNVQPAELNVSPNTSWPDIVYYHSFTHSGMGGRIYVVDRHRRNIGKKNCAGIVKSSAASLMTTLLTLLLLK